MTNTTTTPCAICESEPGTVAAMRDDQPVMVCTPCYRYETDQEPPTDGVPPIMVRYREELPPGILGTLAWAGLKAHGIYGCIVGGEKRLYALVTR